MGERPARFCRYAVLPIKGAILCSQALLFAKPHTAKPHTPSLANSPHGYHVPAWYTPCMAGPGHLADRWQSLTVEQKLSVGVLGVAGLVALVFGLVQLRHTLVQPFTTDVQTLVELKKQYGPSEEERIAEEKKTDTDGDGVTDYDEANVYHTSQYVRDSDSDGEADNIEIAKGTDPNCAKGKACLSVVSGTEAATSSATTFEPPPSPDYSLYPGAGTGGGTPSSVPPREPAAIRAYLQASGWSAAEVASFTDAQILEAYDQSIRSSGGEANASSTVSAP